MTGERRGRFGDVTLCAILLAVAFSSQAARLAPDFLSLNLYEAASMESGVVGQVNRGDELRLLQLPDADPYGFVLVERESDGLSGYIRHRFLIMDINQTIGRPINMGDTSRLVDTVRSVKLRAEPDLRSPVVGWLVAGVEVEVLGRQSQQDGGAEFCSVKRRADGVQGFMVCQYLTPSRSLASVGEAPVAQVERSESGGQGASLEPPQSESVSIDPAGTRDSAKDLTEDLGSKPSRSTLPDGPPRAASPPQPARRWFAELSGAAILSSADNAALTGALQGASPGALVLDVDEQSAGASLRVGYRFSAGWVALLGYDHLGQFDVRVEQGTISASDEQLARALEKDGPGGGASLSLLLRRDWLTSPVALHAQVGFAQQIGDGPEIRRNGRRVDGDADQTAALVGLMASRQLSAHWAAALGLNHYAFNQPLTSLGLGLRFDW